MKSILVISPHADDEVLGCGGTLLKHLSQKHTLNWILVTNRAKEDPLFESRQKEIEMIRSEFNFEKFYDLGFLPATLDRVPKMDLITKLANLFKLIQPEIVYLPFPGDAHSDHRHVFESAIACTKKFRNPSIARVLCYEVPSETDFGFNPLQNSFRPNVFVDISSTLQMKVNLMKIYKGEMKPFPFPRSEDSIRSLSKMRGAIMGVEAAEAFHLIAEHLDIV